MTYQITSEIIRIAAESVLQESESPGPWEPLSHQIAPQGDWYGWFLRAGRGAGKTAAAANYIVNHVHGPPCLSGSSPHWIGIIAPTLGDAATSCFSGPSGIHSFDDTAKMRIIAGGLMIRWSNGSEAKLFGSNSPDDVERLRAGGNRCLFWLEELAAWRYLQECWDQMRFGLRVGPRPHWIASSTLKPRPLIKKIIQGEVADVVMTQASTYDNPYLSENIRSALVDTYGSTQLGSQELHGNIVEQDDNALWTRDMIDDHRVMEIPQLSRITVGVDPSGGAGEQGIVVVGKNEVSILDGQKRKKEIHGYVLDDYSCNLSPDGWGRKAIQAAIDYSADDICVETNFGGDMAIAVIQGAAEQSGVSIPIRTVRASRGKRPRAEPVSALASRGKWHHIGMFEQLEDQLCTWTPESNYSPDRLDAMVWGAWQARIVDTARLNAVGYFGGQSMIQKIG